jgi:hypothetical protein
MKRLEAHGKAGGGASPLTDIGATILAKIPPSDVAQTIAGLPEEAQARVMEILATPPVRRIFHITTKRR